MVIIEQNQDPNPRIPTIYFFPMSRSVADSVLIHLPLLQLICKQSFSFFFTKSGSTSTSRWLDCVVLVPFINSRLDRLRATFLIFFQFKNDLLQRTETDAAYSTVSWRNQRQKSISTCHIFYLDPPWEAKKINLSLRVPQSFVDVSYLSVFLSFFLSLVAANGIVESFCCRGCRSIDLV